MQNAAYTEQDCQTFVKNVPPRFHVGANELKSVGLH